MAVVPATAFVEEKAHGPKTTGEKIFDFLTYGVMGTVGTFVASVGFAFLAQRKFEKTWNNTATAISKPFIQHLKIEDSAKQADVQKNANNLLLSIVLMMGGNLFVAPIGWMEARKKDIVHSFNQRFGSEKDVLQGDVDVENQPPVKFGPLLKSRLLAWATVFTSLTVASKFFEKPLTAFTQKGEDIAVKAADRIGSKMNREDVKNIGGNSAIDLFATIACTSMLYLFSKAFSRKEAAKMQLAKTDDSVTQMPQSRASMQGESNREDERMQAGQPHSTRHQDKVTESRGQAAEVAL